MALQIRKSSYRGHDGFMVCGKDPKGRKVDVFCRTRRGALEMRDLIQEERDNDLKRMAEIFRRDTERDATLNEMAKRLIDALDRKEGQ